MKIVLTEYKRIKMQWCKQDSKNYTYNEYMLCFNYWINNRWSLIYKKDLGQFGFNDWLIENAGETIKTAIRQSNRLIMEIRKI